MNLLSELFKQIKLRPNSPAIQIIGESSFLNISFHELGLGIKHYAMFLTDCGSKKVTYDTKVLLNG